MIQNLKNALTVVGLELNIEKTKVHNPENQHLKTGN